MLADEQIDEMVIKLDLDIKTCVENMLDIVDIMEVLFKKTSEQPLNLKRFFEANSSNENVEVDNVKSCIMDILNAVVKTSVLNEENRVAISAESTSTALLCISQPSPNNPIEELDNVCLNSVYNFAPTTSINLKSSSQPVFPERFAHPISSSFPATHARVPFKFAEDNGSKQDSYRAEFQFELSDIKTIDNNHSQSSEVCGKIIFEYDVGEIGGDVKSCVIDMLNAAVKTFELKNQDKKVAFAESNSTMLLPNSQPSLNNPIAELDNICLDRDSTFVPTTNNTLKSFSQPVFPKRFMHSISSNFPTTYAKVPLKFAGNDGSKQSSNVAEFQCEWSDTKTIDNNHSESSEVFGKTLPDTNDDPFFTSHDMNEVFLESNTYTLTSSSAYVMEDARCASSLLGELKHELFENQNLTQINATVFPNQSKICSVKNRALSCNSVLSKSLPIGKVWNKGPIEDRCVKSQPVSHVEVDFLQQNNLYLMSCGDVDCMVHDTKLSDTSSNSTNHSTFTNPLSKSVDKMETSVSVKVGNRSSQTEINVDNTYNKTSNIFSQTCKDNKECFSICSNNQNDNITDEDTMVKPSFFTSTPMEQDVLMQPITSIIPASVNSSGFAWTADVKNNRIWCGLKNGVSRNSGESALETKKFNDKISNPVINKCISCIEKDFNRIQEYSCCDNPGTSNQCSITLAVENDNHKPLVMKTQDLSIAEGNDSKEIKRIDVVLPSLNNSAVVEAVELSSCASANALISEEDIFRDSFFDGSSEDLKNLLDEEYPTNQSYDLSHNNSSRSLEIENFAFTKEVVVNTASGQLVMKCPSLKEHSKIIEWKPFQWKRNASANDGEIDAIDPELQQYVACANDKLTNSDANEPESATVVHHCLSPEKGTKFKAVSSDMVVPTSVSAGIAEADEPANEITNKSEEFSQPKNAVAMSNLPQNAPKTFLEAFQCLQDPELFNKVARPQSHGNESYSNLSGDETARKTFPKDTIFDIRKSNCRIVPQAVTVDRQRSQLAHSKLDQKVPSNEELLPFGQSENLYGDEVLSGDKKEALSSEDEDEMKTDDGLLNYDISFRRKFCSDQKERADAGFGALDPIRPLVTCNRPRRLGLPHRGRVNLCNTSYKPY